MKFLSRQEELVLLAVWRLGDNAYCVPIRQQVSATAGRDWSFGAIYVPLNRLERKGLVRSHMDEPTHIRGGKSKRMYQLTKEGRNSLAEVKKLQKAMWDGIPDFSLD